MKPKLNTAIPERDLCWTPPYATEALCHFLIRQMRYKDPIELMTVWEPATGDGHMSEVLRAYFNDVISSDLSVNQDFLKTEPSELIDCIITNPPYTAKTKYAFIERCVELGKPFALLMPTETISAATAQESFSRIGGVSMLHFDTRVDFKQQGRTWRESQAQFPTAWFIHGFGLEPNKNYFVSIKEAKKQFKQSLRGE